MSPSGAGRSVVVLGGSVAGSAAALQLAGAGWQVTLVDPELGRITSPGSDVAVRPGAPHTVHAHGFGSRAHVELRDRLPDVHRALLDAGAHEVPLRSMVPPALADGGRPGDGDLTILQVRRHTFDRVLATAVTRAPVTRVPSAAAGLLIDDDASPPVLRGVRLADGSRVAADVVVDAGGRRTPVPGWLAAAGLVQPERRDECVARYYTRHYRIVGTRPPLNIGFADVHAYACHVQLMFLGDSDTAMIALAVHDDDRVLTLLRRHQAFDALLAANPGFDEWRTVLEPATDVFCLGAFDNRMRSLVSDGRPLVLGLHQVGDSLAMTNPTRGRGVGMALMAVGALTDVLQAGGSPEEQSSALEGWRSRVLLPYYRECALSDSIASDQLRAGLAGRAVPPTAPPFELPADHPVSAADIETAADHDPDLFRLLMRASAMLDDDRSIASAEVADRVRRVLARRPAAPAGEIRERPRRALDDRRTLEELVAPYA